MNRNLNSPTSLRLNDKLQEQLEYCSKELDLNNSDTIRQSIKFFYNHLKK